MLKIRNLLFILLFFIASCSNEKYDISKAINILQDRVDPLNPNSRLEDAEISLEGKRYYGDLSSERIAKLWFLSSNFEIIGDEVFYISSNSNFIKLGFDGKKTWVSFKERLNKKKNIKSSLITIKGNDALIVNNAGDIIKIDISSMQVAWSANVEDVITVKPFITEKEAVVPTSSGAILVFDIASGSRITTIEKMEDPLGMNFNLISGLSTLNVDAANLFVSYYKNQLLFFDANTKIKLYTFSLGQDNLDFSKISSTPIFYRSSILSSTQNGLSALSLVSGISIWRINGNFRSNTIATDGFVFGFEKETNSIIAVSAADGEIKWKAHDELPENMNKVWFALWEPEYLLFIQENGSVGKLNILDGSLISFKKRAKYSPNFNYQLVDGKIYFTDRTDNLIVLK